MSQLDEPDPRAVDALDRLARSSSPSIWERLPRWERLVTAVRAPSSEGAEPTVARRSTGHVRMIAAGIAVAVLAATLVLARRPEPFDAQMPLAEAASPGTVLPSGTPPVAPGGPGTGTTEATDSEDLLPAPPVLVHVAGAVAAPGVVELPSGSRVVDAVRAAGGLGPDADPDRLNLAAVIEDGHRVVVPVVGQPAPEELAPTGGTGPARGGGDGVGGSLIDLNSASQEQLEALPGVGPATSAAIVAHRDANGPFRTVESLIDVRGIGEAKLDAVRELVTVG